uniref:Kell metallo-endopeptidase (Kell blood group) n=1 Tax=Neogobius melanostomus TaxID=47308 RepID=A0A8C6WWT8_9GOBI
MRNYGTFPFFNLLVGKDPNETTHGRSQNYIQIDQPELLIPIEWNSQMEKSQVKKTETLRPFLILCMRYLALLGAPPSSSLYHVGNFISLSSELAVAAAPLQYRVTKQQLYQRMTIRSLQNQAPMIDWLSCLRTAFDPVPLTEDEAVLVHNLQYIIQMSRTIHKWLHKPDHSNSGPFQTFMLLNLLHSMMPALDSRFTETMEQVDPRWKSCVLETERGFDSVLTHLLNERMAHAQVTEIIENIFSSMRSALHGHQWENQQTRKTVMKKVHSLTPRLWTSQKSDEAEIDLFVSEMTVGTNFFWNYAQLLSLLQKRRIKLLAEQSEAADTLSVRPVLRGDELVFPLGMFVPPLFHPTYPRAYNYGVIGFLIAKDILHLLLPDIHAQSKNVHVVADCVWTHYLSVTNRSIAGNTSLSTAQQQEVWVQYSALQIALQAYYQSLKRNSSDTSLSGFSHTRLFLTAFSQINCDSDPHQDFMPLEPSFLVKVFCANSTLCENLHCPSDKHDLKTC